MNNQANRTVATSRRTRRTALSVAIAVLATVPIATGSSAASDETTSPDTTDQATTPTTAGERPRVRQARGHLRVLSRRGRDESSLPLPGVRRLDGMAVPGAATSRKNAPVPFRRLGPATRPPSSQCGEIIDLRCRRPENIRSPVIRAGSRCRSSESGGARGRRRPAQPAGQRDTLRLRSPRQIARRSPDTAHHRDPTTEWAMVGTVACAGAAANPIVGRAAAS